MVVEPGYPFRGDQFDRLFGFSRRAAVNQFGLVEPVDPLGQRIGVAVDLAAHSGLYIGLGQGTSAERDRDLRAMRPRPPPKASL